MEIEEADIVQITNPEHHWYPCLIVVNEVKSFGCQGYAVIPSNGQERANGQAFIRLDSNDFEKVGRAIVVLA